MTNLRPELKLGELVTISDHKESTGGLIYKIVKRGEPRVAAYTKRAIEKKRWRPHPGKWAMPETPENGTLEKWIVTQYGHWTAEWKKIPEYEANGYVRLAPVYEFYPTIRGKNPKGLGGTVLVHMTSYMFSTINHVTLTDLARKYAEMGKLIQDFVSLKSESRDSKQEVE